MITMNKNVEKKQDSLESFIVYIKLEDIYVDIVKIVEKRFEASNY